MNGEMNEMLGRVLNDPNTMGSLMKIAQGLMNNNEASDNPPKTESPAPKDTADNESPPVQLPSGLLSGLPRILAYDENRVNLLNALKPYLNDSRREKVEHILHLLSLMQLAGNRK